MCSPQLFKSMDNIETQNNSSEETYAEISELNVTGGNGAKQADSPISISDDHESDYESYDETEMYENVNDNRNTPSSSPEHSQGKEVSKMRILVIRYIMRHRARQQVRRQGSLLRSSV